MSDYEEIVRAAQVTLQLPTSQQNSTGSRMSGMFTIRNFCEWSGLCRTNVYALINRGDLRAVKCGRRTLIPTNEALRWREALPSFPVRHGTAEHLA
jgi:hypothetical protein